MSMIGKRVVLPKMIGDLLRRRPGTIIEEYEYFYVVKTDIGYNECIFKIGESGVKYL